MATSSSDTSATKSTYMHGLAPRVELMTADEWKSFRKRDTRLLPRNSETLSRYLDRVKGWKYFNDSSRFEEAASWTAKRASKALFRGRDIRDGLRYRIAFGGLCSCTDGLAHRQGPTFWPTLFDFQRTATAGCGRCWFIVQSIALFQTRFTGVDPGRIQVHLREPRIAFDGDFSRIRVRWLPDGSIPTLEPYAAQLVQEYGIIDLELYADDGYKVDRRLFCRALPPIRSDDDACVNKIKRWIDECVREHGCGLAMTETGLPTRLVEVSSDDHAESIRLAIGSEITDKAAQFAALSHCWGDKRDRVKAVPKTKIDTLQQHLEKIDIKELTPTFRDTITLVRRLGLKYVWIDSLCIVQDDPADFAREAARMALIYSQAHVVIAATRGSTGDAGLFHNRRAAQKLTMPDTHRHKGSYLHVTEAISHEAFLTNDPYRFNSTPLFERAWCFQERLLGKRVVHFSEDEIIFECGENLDCECRYIQLRRSSGTFKTKTLKSLSRVVTPTSRIELWYSVVEPYSACALHDERDRLPALSGFAGLVASTELDEYCAGLWRHEFPSGLLWRAVRAAPGESETYRPQKYCGPSWSWIAVRARIEAHISWHFANEVVAEVLDVQTIPTSVEDRLGAVDAAFLILAGPAVHINLQQDSSGHQQTRDCLMSLAHTFTNSDANQEAFGENEDPERSQRGEPQSHSTESQPFQLDVPSAVDGQQAICIAIERWHPRINSGQGTCLVLQAVPGEATYSRLGLSFCPASWFAAALRIEVKIV
ncbi:hypothetical protein H2200_009155 [Cladophialophora chaetospira]|uniref:Heterokaryon incompatibility domain-containing protein n=1 Tax=Cladophialophora chaetospira TaxID=386627 RepID=A0AA38X3K4_9EURO|nr:hypothetical protein H2200_009155 [Cladophialophora chaetospira]